MDDRKKTKAQLIEELTVLRQRIERMELSGFQKSPPSIQEDRDRLLALVNSISAEVWLADTKKRFTLANPSALQEFGLDTAGGIDVEKFAESLEVYRPDGTPRRVEEFPPLRALKGEVVKNEEEIIRTPRRGELRCRQVSSTPVKNDTGTIIGSVSVVIDITDRQRAEEALRESERRESERAAELAVLLDAVPTPVFIAHDEDCCHITGNRAADIMRHSEATIVQVFLKKQNGNILLKVHDNGKGIIMESQSTRSGSFGIIGMQERVRSFGGEFTVSGTSADGTTITVSIPHDRGKLFVNI